MSLRDPALHHALGLMHTQPDRPWTVEALASAASMSRAGFARRFAQTTGMRPLSYLTRWRMQLAARRLRDSDSPINVIATEVGYSSDASFSRAFCREHGVSPGHNRQQDRIQIAGADGVERKSRHP
jgi:transcriptional regulator GlxA family with amidase domain